MRIAFIVAVLVPATITTVGCGSSPSDGTDGGQGGSGSGSGATVVCLESSMCTISTFSGILVSGAGEQATACTKNGGQVVTSCPTAKLVGCCTITTPDIVNDVCYYTGTEAAQAKDCASAGAYGKWSTTP
jgi:hypothetical protein